jgi:asparagine synthase (glutamine-hydrolysing)
VCGIAGIVSANFEEAAILGMLTCMEHRGPDETVFEVSEGYCFGSCRLAINGLEDGRQPLRAPGVSMVYNGEVYNCMDLRSRANAGGSDVTSRVDGAPIPHLFRQLGPQALGLIDGPYALALWDSWSGSMILARDPLGEKPLYYRELSQGGLAFSSETRPLMDLSGERNILNTQALWDVPTFLWTPEPDTAIRDIHALPSGHALIYQNGDFELVQILRKASLWPIRISDREAVETTRQLVYDAVRTRAMSEVPLGSFLSGGLDSSIVTALLRQQRHDVERAFSVQLPPFHDLQHGYVDESLQARDLATKLNLPVTIVEISHERARDLLPDFVRAGDSPNAVSSGLGVMAVAEAALDLGIKVLLSGDCADELFGGYSWYPYVGLLSETSFLENSEPSFHEHGLSLQSRLEALSHVPGPQRALSWHYYASETAKRSVFSNWISDQTQPSVRIMNEWRSESNWGFLDFVNNDRDFYLPQEMLRKADRFAMRRSVEVRVPFASPWLLDFARVLAPSQLVRQGVLKWTLRQAFNHLLPKSVLSRDKHGFNFPMAAWLRGPWSDLVEDTFSARSPLGDLGLIGEHSHQAALNLLNDPNRDQSHAVFSWIVMAMWLEQVSVDVDR